MDYLVRFYYKNKIIAQRHTNNRNMAIAVYKDYIKNSLIYSTDADVVITLSYKGKILKKYQKNT